AWVKWARHCRIPVFVELQRKIMRHKDHILNTIELGVTNARIEATNNKIKLLIRKAYGFRDVDSMIDMVLLYCSDLKIPLPNRNRVKYA
ncbi:transposase, partial [Butyrivibrio sp. INlla16]